MPNRSFRALLSTTLVVGVLLTASGAGAQIGGDTLSRVEDVTRQFARIAPSLGPSIWPGYRPDTIPLVFVLRERGSILTNWRGTLPQSFTAIAGHAALAWKSQQNLGASSTGTELDGRNVAQVVVSSLDAAYLIPTAMHEAFHVFERASIVPGKRFGRGENAFYVSSYPVFDVSNEEMFAIEGRLLARALAAPTRSLKLKLAREFVAVRRTRHRALEPSYAEFDDASELNEGLAEYALVRTLMAMQNDNALPAQWRTSARELIAQHDARLAALTADVKQSLRLRFYYTGPAQAVLLDQLAGPTWKRDLMRFNETLTDALASATGLDAPERSSLATALGEIDTASSRRDAATAVRNLGAIRQHQVDSVLSQPGILLELSASELPSKDFGFCGFDPQNHLQISPTVQLQTRWWRPCSGSAMASEFNVPSVHDDNAGTVRAVIGSESDVKLTIAGKPAVLADAQRIDAATDVDLFAPRANVHASRARIEKEGRTLRITPLPPQK